MAGRYKQPAWGVLVRAPEARVREVLASFEDHMLYRTKGAWTAGFYMDQTADCRDDTAGDYLAYEECDPVYRFEFSDRGFVTKCWNDGTWETLQYEAWFDEWCETIWIEPQEILHKIGIVPPYEDPDVPPPLPPRPVRSRRATIVQGASVDQVRVLVPDGLRIEPSPRGAIVYDADLKTRFALWKLGPVIEVAFTLDDGFLHVVFIEDEEEVASYRPDYVNVEWKGRRPFLPNIEGATDPGDIVDKLGIPRWFLDRATSSS